MAARRMVQSYGASSPARSRFRRPASGLPWRSASAPSRKCRRAVTSSLLRSATTEAPSPGTSPVAAQWRTWLKCGSAATPVKSANVSVPKARALGRAMRSSSSTHTTVGTFEMA